MKISALQLNSICPNLSGIRASYLVQFINDTLARFEINTPLRAAHFLAQLGHESAGFRFREEIASGDAYENRKDLGNSSPGDGTRYKGRGFLQITGRSNYRQCGLALGLDLEHHPEQLLDTRPAMDSAGWFWQSHGLNALADADDIEKVTKRVNGGLNGIESRRVYLERAKKVLGL